MINGLVIRLAAISDMLVETYNPSSDFWIWMNSQKQYSEKLEQYKDEFQEIFSQIPKRTIGEYGKEKYVPEPSFEFGVALNNAKTSNVYLSNLLTQERYFRLSDFLRRNITFLEEIHAEYQKVSKEQLDELKQSRDPRSIRAVAELQTLVRKPRRARSTSVLKASSSSESSCSDKRTLPHSRP